MTKKLSVNELKRITGISAKQIKTVSWHTAKIFVKQILNVDEYINTIRSIIADCTTPENDIAFELIDFAIRVNIISAYAFVELPNNYDDLFYIIYASDIYDTVCSVVNTAQINSIINTVYRIIDGR